MATRKNTSTTTASPQPAPDSRGELIVLHLDEAEQHMCKLRGLLDLLQMTSYGTVEFMEGTLSSTYQAGLEIVDEAMRELQACRDVGNYGVRS